MDRAVAADLRALRLAGNALQSRCISLGNLAISLYSRHRCQGDPRDLDAAIEHLRTVLRLLPAGHPEQNTVQGNLALMLAARRTREDLDGAVALWRTGLARERHGSREWAESAGQLAQGLYGLYTMDGDAELLDEAWTLLERAVRDLPAGGFGDTLRVNRAVLLATRHQIVRPDPGGLDEAIAVLDDFVRRAADAADPEPADVAAAHLAQALTLRYTDRGNPADLSRAAALRKPNGSTLGNYGAPGSDSARGSAISADIQATVALFEYLSDARQADVDQAIVDQQKALDRCGDDFVRRSPLVVNLALTLAVRHHARRGADRAEGGAPSEASSADLTRALDLLRENDDENVPAQHRAGAMALSGALLLERHMTDPGRYAADLTASERLLTDALDHPGLDYRSKLGVTSRLAYCRLAIARHTGDTTSLEAAVDLARHAADGIPAESPLRAGALGCLADVLLARAETTGLASHHREAGELSRQVCRDYADSDRAAVYQAARLWSESAWRRGAMDEVVEAGRIAVPLLHDIASLQLGRDDKAVPLRQAEGLASRTAFALVARGESAEAAATLETGRAVMLAETMQREHPDLLRLLASEYQNLSGRFRRAAEELTTLERRLLAGPRDLPVVDGTREAYRLRLRALDDVVRDIRGLPGFGTFLRPPAPAELADAADVCRSTLVYLAATDRGGIALVVPAPSPGTAGRPVRAVHLPELTPDFERQSVTALRDAVAHADPDEGAPTDLDEAERRMDELTGRLWESVMAPVIPAVGTGTPTVLIPDGPLGMLPLHAAARPDLGTPTGRRFVIDDIPVAMAPSARTLSVAVARTSRAPVRRLLAVRDPSPSDDIPLPGAAAEIQRVRAALPPRIRVCELHGAEATRQEVQESLAEVEICHFACHAHGYADRPLDGGLSLAHGERLTVRDMFAMPSVTARLAVLSACDSGRVDESLLEEVVGLATGFLQAGFGAVIASLWPLEDAPAAAQMALTYRYWLGEGKTLPAALGSAMAWLRDSTNEEKFAEFPELAFFDPDDSAAADDPEWLATREHSSPLAWAAFTCLGI
ncbi:CHAT domain-containing protein [Streptomyces sp. FR-108]|uniref:CHAT domain-containing protein n=1 Tax=Streptomyces sp. FR-108 TaxID=3416665 RepID=UPI003CFA6157